jgi:hypothetical protein
MKSKVVAFSVGALMSNHALAYDAETHGFITYNAFQESVLAQSGAGSTIHLLGLDRLDAPLPFHIYWNSQQPIAQNPDSYVDAVMLRQPNEYERCQLQNLEKVAFFDVTDPMLSNGSVTFFPIHNWLLRGALREDDLTHAGYVVAHADCGEPEPDPNGPINRVMNHFYDPIQQRRGQRLGAPIQPMYLEPADGGTPPTDVDAVPLPAFAGLSVLAQGTIRFDSDPTLLACPVQPTGAPVTAESASLLDYLDALETARDLGVSGEKHATLTQYH